MSVTSLISSGPLLLAMPVAAAAGAVTFLSPCCLPLVPGYLAYITGMSGADSDVEGATAAGAAPGGPPSAPRGRLAAGTALFVLGFSLVNILAFFKRNARLVTRIGGLMLVALGLVEVTGAWTAVIAWMHTHWFETYAPQL